MPIRDDQQCCSFCTKPRSEVAKLIAGPGGVTICGECVNVCGEIIADSGNPAPGNGSLKPSLKPQEIKRRLDDHIIGQDETKKKLAVAVYHHDTRARMAGGKANGIEMGKSNVLLVGPTGCGKTLLAETLARILDVPFAICDATPLTQAGYVGEDVENILLRLVQAADGDIGRAERGIIYLDEVDKIGRKDENPSITRDVSGEGVQQSLLKIIEGTVAMVPPSGGRKHPQTECVPFDTRNVLFICGGAFVGLERVVERRIGRKSLGFGASIPERRSRETADLLTHVEPEDLVRYGLIPEFVGRLPVVATLAALDEDALVRILVEPRSALVKQWTEQFRVDNVELTFTDEALRAVASVAAARGTGARALRSVLESVMLEASYSIPSDGRDGRLEISAEHVEAVFPRLERAG
jgi:ATP-dependent Clp protease ATP-binding subunit ClpX